jgi:tRNA A-37 threonylcarbamoyl transferase component Bud32
MPVEQAMAARDYLALPGVVVSGHVGRNVSRVQVDGGTAYLKREHRVRLRDRLRSFLAGFGFVSLSEREAIVLRKLRSLGLPAPVVIACGEEDRQAFLLVAEADGAIDLRKIPEVTESLATTLGTHLAHLHDAGIDQPDLFAKHFLVNPDTEQVTILDWQRARIRNKVSWDHRIQSLGVFRATCSDDVIPADRWEQLLKAYSAKTCANLSRLIERVVKAACESRKRRSIRDQLKPSAADQELVRIGGETVCAVPAVASDLAHPEVIDSLYDSRNKGRVFHFGSEAAARLVVSSYAYTPGRAWAVLRGKAWRSPELKLARLLFHLERYGIPAPKLLAYGQRIESWRRASAFVLQASPEGRCPTIIDAPALRTFLTRLHEAGVCIRKFRTDAKPFVIDGNTPSFADANCFRLNRKLSARQMNRDIAQLDAWLGERR